MSGHFLQCTKTACSRGLPGIGGKGGAGKIGRREVTKARRGGGVEVRLSRGGV